MNSARTDDNPKNLHCSLTKFFLIWLYIYHCYMTLQIPALPRNLSVPSNEFALQFHKEKFIRICVISVRAACCSHLIILFNLSTLKHEANITDCEGHNNLVLFILSCSWLSYTVFPKHSVFQYHPCLVLSE